MAGTSLAISCVQFFHSRQVTPLSYVDDALGDFFQERVQKSQDSYIDTFYETYLLSERQLQRKLFKAVSERDKLAFKKLTIEQDKSPDTEIQEGITPLMWAVKKKDLEMALFYLEMNAKANRLPSDHLNGLVFLMVEDEGHLRCVA